MTIYKLKADILTVSENRYTFIPNWAIVVLPNGVYCSNEVSYNGLNRRSIYPIADAKTEVIETNLTKEDILNGFINLGIYCPMHSLSPKEFDELYIEMCKDGYSNY